jgi:CDP-diacylglycerol--glycerol-3-phosphate 3-phosphatidyltransferase
MSYLYRYKPLKDRLLGPAFGRLRDIGVTPNMITVAGLLLAMVGGVFAAYGLLVPGLVMFLLGACLDAVDGSFARVCGMSTEFGRYLDCTCDRLAELVFIAGAVIGGCSPVAYAVVGGSVVLMLTRVLAHRLGNNSDIASFGRPERLLLLTLGLIFTAPFGDLLFVAAGLLCAISTIQIISDCLWPTWRRRPVEERAVTRKEEELA